jgi:hypothetical protein
MTDTKQHIQYFFFSTPFSSAPHIETKMLKNVKCGNKPRT